MKITFGAAGAVAVVAVGIGVACAAVAVAQSGATGPELRSDRAVSTAQRREPPVVSPSTLSATPRSVSLTTTSGTSVQLNVSVRSTGGAGFLDVVQDGGAFESTPLIVSQGGGSYLVKFAASDRLPTGLYRGSLRFRMCLESPCVRVIPGTTNATSYKVNVGWRNAGEWQTFQRNGSHDGFVPVAIDPARITPVWAWQRPSNGGLTRINAPVTSAGKVFVSDDQYFGAVSSLFALDEATGSLLWQQDFLDYPALNPPAVSNGRVYVATTGHSQTFLWSFAESDGEPKFQTSFSGQWPHVLAPTVANGRVYTNGGYYGGGIYAYDALDGTPTWSQFSGDDDMTTPAVKDRRAYFYDGAGLKVYDSANGNVVASITDPYNPGQGYSYHGAPALGSPDHVIAFSGGAFSGTASSSTEQYESRLIVNYSVTNFATRWRTAKTYKTQPAVAEGVVYAGSNNPKSFDAIDEATGQVLWSWVPGTSDTAFYRNVLVTKNLAFVSTNRALYAIDLATHRPVWSHPEPGVVTMSGDGTLYLAVGPRESTGRLVAFRVR